MSLARACAVVFAVKYCLWDFALLLVGYSVRFCGHCFRNVILFFSFSTFFFRLYAIKGLFGRVITKQLHR